MIAAATVERARAIHCLFLVYFECTYLVDKVEMVFVFFVFYVVCANKTREKRNEKVVFFLRDISRVDLFFPPSFSQFCFADVPNRARAVLVFFLLPSPSRISPTQEWK